MNNRTEPRINALDTAHAVILGHPDVTVPCHIRNFSKSGMCITVKEPIPSGQIVKVEWGDHFLVGRARRVSADGEGFQVALELLYCSQWSEPIKEILEATETHATV